jgi:tight adherence protein B
MTLLTALAVAAFCAAIVAILIDERPSWWERIALDFEQPSDDPQAIFDDSHLSTNDGRVTLISIVVFVAVVAITEPLVGLAGVAPACIVASMPHNIKRKKQRLLVRRRLEAWPDAVREIVAALLAARSLHQALVGLTTGGPDLLRPVWKRYAQLSITMDQRSALDSIRQQLADPVSDRVLEVLIIATDSGPAVMLDILSDLAESTNEDLQLAQKVDTANLEQRLTGQIVLILPMVILLLIVVGNSTFADFYRSPIGLVIVTVGTGLGVLGMVIINRLARFPEEPRVFTSLARPKVTS